MLCLCQLYQVCCLLGCDIVMCVNFHSDDSVTSLLDIVDEVESLHNYSHNSNSAPKQQSWSLAETSLSAKPTVGSWSESDSLEESRVLEDVFFVK